MSGGGLYVWINKQMKGAWLPLITQAVSLVLFPAPSLLLIELVKPVSAW